MESVTNTQPGQDYVEAFRGRFISMLRWQQLDEFWSVVRGLADKGWFIYAVGERPPEQPATEQQVLSFVEEVDTLLRREHDEDYCGIVYVDDRESPGFIKIFDPNNLGVSCGFSENPPLPGWILSTIPPVELETALNPPNNRRRWWRRLFE